MILGHNLYRALGGNDFLYSNLRLDKESQVVILGGYQGASCLEISSRYGSKIVVFEPIEAWARTILELTLEVNSLVQVISKAVTSNGRTVQLSLNGDATSELINSSFNEVHSVESVTMLEVNEFAQGKIDLLEINIEGGEYEVVDSLLRNKIEVETLLIQFHKIDGESQAKYENLSLRLAENYHLVFSIPFVWERWDSAQSTESIVTKRQFESVSQFFQETQSGFDSIIDNYRRQLSENVDKLSSHLVDLEVVKQELVTIKNSRSWRLTLPFRRLKRLIRREKL